MQFYVMSKGKFADGGRHWVDSVEQAWNFGEDLECAQRHAETFRDRDCQRSLGITYGRPDEPGHRDAHVVSIL